MLMGVAAWLYLDPRAPGLEGITATWTYGVAGVALLLGWYYQRSRVAAAALAVVVAQAVGTAPWGQGVLFQVLAISLPLTFAMIALFPERPLGSVTGLAQQAAVLLQPVALWLFAVTWPGALERLLSSPLATSQPLYAVPLPLPAAVATLISVVVVASVAAVRPREVELGLFWALGAVIVALRLGGGSAASGAYFAAAGAIMALSVVEHTYALAFRDDVTGLPTRQPLFRAMKAAMPLYSLALIRVEGFHGIRSQFGPQVSEQVLRMVASRLRQVGRDVSVFRCGAAEFAVLLGATPARDALGRLGTLPDNIAAKAFIVRAKNRPKHKPEQAPPAPRSGWVSFHVSARLGIAEAREGMTREQILGAAYESLREARRAPPAEVGVRSPLPIRI